MWMFSAYQDFDNHSSLLKKEGSHLSTQVVNKELMAADKTEKVLFRCWIRSALQLLSLPKPRVILCLIWSISFAHRSLFPLIVLLFLWNTTVRFRSRRASVTNVSWHSFNRDTSILISPHEEDHDRCSVYFTLFPSSCDLVSASMNCSSLCLPRWQVAVWEWNMTPNVQLCQKKEERPRRSVATI